MLSKLNCRFAKVAQLLQIRGGKVEMIEKTSSDYPVNPRAIFLKTLGAVFLAELFVMLFLSLLPSLPLAIEAFLDALILSVLIVPFLYFFLLRPIQKAIKHHEQKEAERSRLKEMDNIKSEFISTAAHELRTPVTAIMGFVELLSGQDAQNTFNEKQRREFLCIIAERSVKLGKIVDDILDVSRIESKQKIPLDKKPLSIKSLLENVLKRSHLISNHNITVDISPKFPEKIEFDEQRIEQVVENLLSNAIKYSPNHSVIVVTAEADDEQCIITVRDLGVGMSSEQADRIYEKFYRADTSDTSTPGLGLGMTIVKQIIDDHGGTISIDSKIGEGTSVSFTLPR